MDQLRSSILQDVELTATKRRFGLFSQPPPLSIGDDSPYKTMKHPRDESGKPITQPRNFATSATKTGKVSSSYFAVPESIYKGDPYVDEYKRKLTEQNSNHKKGKIHETQFKPGSGFKTLSSSSYKYIQQKEGSQPKRPIKDQNGRVKTQARNMVTNPCSKIETNVLKPAPYVSDPYQRKWELQRERQKEEIKKRGEAPFRSMSSGPNLLNKHIKVYGTDAQFTEKKRTVSTMESTMKHEAVFKPSNISRGPLSKFPAFMPENPLPKPPAKKTQDGEKPDIFKPPKPALTRPTPSITLHPSNIRRSVKF